MQQRVISYEQVVDAGARLFLATGTVRMPELQRELAVSRATLYRVVAGRDRLLADVLCRLSEATVDRAFAGARGRGVDALVDVAAAHLTAVARSRPFRRFLAEEPSTAFRVVFLPENEVHTRVVQRWTTLLLALQRRDRLPLPFSAPETANLVVTVTTSMLYTALQSGAEPDLDLARRALRALLTIEQQAQVIDLAAEGAARTGRAAGLSPAQSSVDRGGWVRHGS